MKTFSVQLNKTIDTSYDIAIDHDWLSQVVEDIQSRFSATQYVIISDENVWGFHGEQMKKVCASYGLSFQVKVLPAGEQTKSRTYKNEVEDWMADHRCNRDSLLIAFGGGVIGDLGGYVASTYFRGIPYIQIPTTLLAMVDSSIGGKTAINIPAGKNLVGSFYQPQKVYIDTKFLDTLPDQELKAGMAEVIKIAAICDETLFSYLEEHVDEILQKNTQALHHIIEHNAHNKAMVCSQDEKEQGVRAILNFGHTIGHAVETLMKFELLHGECVAIGMVIETAIGVNLSINTPETLERLKRCVDAYDLPSRIPGRLKQEAIIQKTMVDKKAKQGKPRYVFIEEIGKVHQYEGSYTREVGRDVIH